MASTIVGPGRPVVRAAGELGLEGPERPGILVGLAPDHDAIDLGELLGRLLAGRAARH